MKKVVMVVGLVAATFLLPGRALAQRGPALDTLVRVDEARFDMTTRKSVERSNVVHRTSKQIYNREIFSVKEKQLPLPTPGEVYIVQEEQVVSRTVQDAVPVWVVVERNPTQAPPEPEPTWRYKIK